jgi:hypothetical protein
MITLIEGQQLQGLDVALNANTSSTVLVHVSIGSRLCPNVSQLVPLNGASQVFSSFSCTLPDNTNVFNTPFTDNFLSIIASKHSASASTNSTFQVFLWIQPENDPPSIRGPTAHVTQANVPLELGMFSVDDIDAGENSSAMLNLTLSAQHGVFWCTSLGGLRVWNASNGSAIAVTGSISTINAWLRCTFYASHPNWGGTDTLVLSLNDNGNTGFVFEPLSALRDVTITVENVLQPPVIYIPSVQQEKGAIRIVIFDADSDAVTVHIAVQHGVVSWNTDSDF